MSLLALLATDGTPILDTSGRFILLTPAEVSSAPKSVINVSNESPLNVSKAAIVKVNADCELNTTRRS